MINITTKRCSIGIQLFDALYGFIQSLDKLNYLPPVDIKVDAPYSSADLNILCDFMPVDCTEQELTKYDLIFFCNGGEPLTGSTETMGKLINQENVYLITNSYLTELHPLRHKVVWFPHNIMTCRDYWTRHFYPQYYENIENRSINRKFELIAINGSVRSNRYYFFNLLQTQIPSVLQLSRIGTTVHKLNDSQWESAEDTKFRDWINGQYRDNSIQEPDQYYNKRVKFGIDEKFGDITPGYFVMPEYFEYACVVFPEATWQNDELAITEKAIKCFYAGSLPFPIGGANINRLYNDIGFYTAWNLLPDELKLFDQNTDHTSRYQQAVDAVGWLDANRSVFESQQFEYMANQNRANFLTCDCDYVSVSRLYDIVQAKLKERFGVEL
jgi:hypothetical protein